MNLLGDFIRDLRVELTDEFDRNFERKGFFNEKWDEARMQNRRGSLLMRTGALRRSIRSQSSSNTIRWFSSLPYASIHNNGGFITVTVKMKRYFWAMHLKASGAKQSRSMSAEAGFWKAMALKKIGTKIKIAKRQFIGYHSKIDGIVDKVFQQTLNRYEIQITKTLKP